MKKTSVCKTYTILFLSFFSFFFSACETFNESQTTKELSKAEQQQWIRDTKKELVQLEKDNSSTKETIALLKNDMESVREEVQTLHKNLEIIKRELKPGISDDFSQTNTPKREKEKILFPPLTGNASGIQETLPDFAQDSFAEKNDNEKLMDAKQLLSNAEGKINSGRYKEGIDKLIKLKKKFPNFDTNGHSELLTALAWIKLKQYKYALSPLRNLNLRYASSAEVAYAKSLEAQAYEGDGNFEKAAQLYNEVIALYPRSDLAQESRNGMLRMRGILERN